MPENEGHGFVRLPRIIHDYGNPLLNDASQGRDVNETFHFQGRHTINPRVNYTYDPDFLRTEEFRTEVEEIYRGEGIDQPSGWANRPPVANPDTAETDEDIPVIIDVLANDTDPDGHPLEVVSASAGNGTVVINSDGTVTYTPNEDYHGTDSFTYT
ncbi:MAG: Ig-like domain-containing protein, partial [Thermovirgaceae bacterium]